MNRLLLACFFSLCAIIAFAQPLSYYMPTDVSYDPAIPTPKSVIYHEVGEWHVTHDKLVNYMKAIDAASNRVTLQETGYTYEGRPQLLLVITSPENQAKIETLRAQHLLLSSPGKSNTLNVEDMPTVVWMGYSIHGNESSGANASLLSAYYLAAAKGGKIDDLLKHTIILLDPSFNPDGLTRFSSWANMHKSKTQVSDPNAREFNEVWPGGRFNHYFFDLNRDWLPAQHVESQSRLKLFHQWKPNIFTDHHEQGSNATFFFQPGVPSRTNPNTPKKNQELTGAIGNFHAKYLDSVGSLYFTKEGYDDFYYGKGSTYPDINGGIGILFEQASSRGHAQMTDNGLLTFPFTIRNQFITSLSTLEASRNLRKDLLNFQRDFYNDVIKEANASPVKAYVFGDANDKSKNYHLIEMLLRHQIEVFELKQNVTVGNNKFKTESAFIVPTNQQQYKIIKTMFEKTLEYKDSLFYDVTAWTIPLAFNMPFGVVNSTEGFLGNRVTTALKPVGAVRGGSSNFGYLFGWDDYYAPKLLHALQSNGVLTKVATQQLEVSTADGNKKFTYGSIIIPVQGQKISAQALHSLLANEVKNGGVTIHSISTGLSASGIDLGSSSFTVLKQPKVMMFGGTGTSATDVGEIWHLLDQRFEVPVSIVNVEQFDRIEVSGYNVIIMPSGGYNAFGKTSFDKLKAWVERGGTLIATEDAVSVLSSNAVTKVSYNAGTEKKDSTSSLPYYLKSDEARAKAMTGSIFEATVDISHPLGYGYSQNKVSIFKSNALFMDQNNSPYDSPVMYTDDPLQSGYLYRGNKALVKNSAVINIDNIGRGRVISMVDNLNFRAFWFGTSKMFMNAIFFGDIIRG